MTRDEQETTITYTAADSTVAVWTCLPRDVRRIKTDPRFTVIDSGTYDDGTDWVQATIPVERWSITSGVKRRGRPLTADQRAAAVERLRRARADA